MGVGAIQVQFRRGIAALVSAFVGAPGETIVDLTSMRLCLQDGATAGGWPQDRAGLTLVSDANYQALPTDVVIVYTKLTSARTVTLPSAMSYPLGQTLFIVDGTQSSSLHNVSASVFSSTEKIDGSTALFTLAATPSPAVCGVIKLTCAGNLASTANWVQMT